MEEEEEERKRKMQKEKEKNKKENVKRNEWEIVSYKEVF